MNIEDKRFDRLLACPSCKSPSLTTVLQEIICKACGESFNISYDTPVLIRHDSPVFVWYDPKKPSTPSTSKGVKQSLKALYRWLKPEDRVWSVKSQKVIQRLLEELNPDVGDNNVVLIGTGFESVYRQLLRPYKNILRIGLATQGSVDLCTDICDIPLINDGVDLILSSSVLEHVYNPEKAVEEMFRVVKPRGYVYAEIPFMRAFHMMPVDYQRYTISGIEELFKRHGFTLVSKGICSGPFTASVLFFEDFYGGLLSFNKYIMSATLLLLSVIFHPIKYLDRLFEDAKWAEINACNFYYVGKKNEVEDSKSKENDRLI